MMDKIAEVLRVHAKYESLRHIMNEKIRRQWAATEAESIGWGGVSLVSAGTGLARNTILSGIAELREREKCPNPGVERGIRKDGGGRKSITEKDPGLLKALDRLVDSSTRGHPMTHLRSMVFTLENALSA